MTSFIILFHLRKVRLLHDDLIYKSLYFEEATSSSDATSRETTPESDDENDDEEQDDDEDDDAFADEDTTYNRNDTVNDDSIPLKDCQTNPVRDVEELMDSYRSLFPEYEVNRALKLFEFLFADTKF